VPLMGAMFLAMVWHARRRQAAMREAEELADSRASLLERQERFLHDVSHELRTPVTIARGHLELLGRSHGAPQELAVALDELARIERIIARLLLLANAERPDFLVMQDIDVEPFLEDVFMRWSEVAPRVWRLGTLARGRLRADEEAVRAALDALLENAVKFTDESEPVELRAVGLGDDLLLEVADGGCGVPGDAVERIFERFGRADDARTRTNGGAGLGLSIVGAIAKAHSGSCQVIPQARGTVFSVRLPGFRPSGAPADGSARAGDSASLSSPLVH
jgi:signal transduction histidine kinase